MGQAVRATVTRTVRRRKARGGVRTTGEVRCLIYCATVYFSRKRGVISSVSTQYRPLLLVAALLSATVLSGCYTLLKHPRLAQMDYQRPDDKRCANCHSSAEVWSFNHTPGTPTYVGYSGKWADYYDIPWWYQRVWDFEPSVKTKPVESRDEEKDSNENKNAE